MDNRATHQGLDLEEEVEVFVIDAEHASEEESDHILVQPSLYPRGRGLRTAVKVGLAFLLGWGGLSAGEPPEKKRQAPEPAFPNKVMPKAEEEEDAAQEVEEQVVIERPIVHPSLETWKAAHEKRIKELNARLEHRRFPVRMKAGEALREMTNTVNPLPLPTKGNTPDHQVWLDHFHGIGKSGPVRLPPLATSVFGAFEDLKNHSGYAIELRLPKEHLRALKRIPAGIADRPHSFFAALDTLCRAADLSWQIEGRSERGSVVVIKQRDEKIPTVLVGESGRLAVFQKGNERILVSEPTQHIVDLVRARMAEGPLEELPLSVYPQAPTWKTPYASIVRPHLSTVVPKPAREAQHSILEADLIVADDWTAAEVPLDGSGVAFGFQLLSFHVTPADDKGAVFVTLRRDLSSHIGWPATPFEHDMRHWLAASPMHCTFYDAKMKPMEATEVHDQEEIEMRTMFKSWKFPSAPKKVVFRGFQSLAWGDGDVQKVRIPLQHPQEMPKAGN